MAGTLSPAVPIAGITALTPGLTCSVTGLGSYECVGDHLDIPAGGSVEWTVTVTVASDFPADQITHTKEMVWPDREVKDKRPENDRQVSTITIEGPKEEKPPPPPPPPPPALAQAADLLIIKTAKQPSCIAGLSCGFAVTVQNVGDGDYVGPLQIDDVTTPANTQLAGVSPSPWSCSGSNGHYTCQHPVTTLAPGASKTLSLALTTSRNATGGLNNCSTLAWTDASSVFAVQAALNALGFPAGNVDGKVGPTTGSALEAYQAAVGLPVTGRIDDALLRRLFGSWGIGDANGGNDRACATVVVETPPPPEIICQGGKISNNQCFCPAGTQIQQFGTNAFRCVTPPPPPPEIVCQGGKISNNQCFCPAGTQVQQIGPNAFRCVTPPPPPPEIVCQGGKISNNQCFCPAGTQVQQIGPNAYRCVPQLVCQGGKVSNNECVCPKGTDLKQTGPNAYRCVPTIVCQGGKVSNNECVCPKGTDLKQTGPNAYRCVPTIVCQGGKVSNNECVCPKGTDLKQTGPNAYRCVTPPPPTIVCQGGKVSDNECVCPKGTEIKKTGPNAYKCVTVQPTLVCQGGRVNNKGQCVCPNGTSRVKTGDNAYSCVPTSTPTPQ